MTFIKTLLEAVTTLVMTALFVSVSVQTGTMNGSAAYYGGILIPGTFKGDSVVMAFIKNTILLPFRLLWNVIVTTMLVVGFVLWFGFIFGSVIAVILVLIFKPELFLLPLIITRMYTKTWDQ